jgi:hypothetical protein
MYPAILLILGALASLGALQPQAERAVELAGRSAGQPQRCIAYDRLDGLRVSDSDRHTLLYGRGRTIWASHLDPGCPFRVNDNLVSEPLSRYCRGDLVRSFDSSSRIPGPTCVLGDFVPYTR